MSAALERGESPGETCVVIAINDDEYGIPVPHVRELVGYREEHFRATPQRRRSGRGHWVIPGEKSSGRVRTGGPATNPPCRAWP